MNGLTGMLKRADIGTVGRHRVDVDVVGHGCAPVAELGADVLDRGDPVRHVARVAAKTVESYRTRIMKKLDTPNTAGIVRYAIRQGLIQV